MDATNSIANMVNTVVFVLIALTASDGGAADSRQVPQVLSAAAVAYVDFNERIALKQQANPLDDFFSKIGNYEINITDNGSTCVVRFAPRPFHGNLVRGGSASYVVDVENGRILDFKQYR